MTDENIFAETTETTEVPATLTQTPTLPTEVMELVGEGKKYKSTEDALKALPHAQAHIARLEQEAKELREKVAQAKAIDDLYDTLNARTQTGTEATPTAPVVDESLVDAVLERKLKEISAQKQRQENLQTVSKALTDKFGEKAQEVFKKKAEELGVNESFIRDVVAASSKAGLELFGLGKQEAPSTAAPAGGVNTLAVKSNAPAPTVKPIMGGATTADMLASWRSASPLNKQ